MEVVHARCCGIDVHQASLAVCVTIKEGKSDKHKLRCGTTTAELLRLADWLSGYQVTHVAMEATGVYWKPVCTYWRGSSSCCRPTRRKCRPCGAGKPT
jgi:transposase